MLRFSICSWVALSCSWGVALAQTGQIEAFGRFAVQEEMRFHKDPLTNTFATRNRAQNYRVEVDACSQRITRTDGTWSTEFSLLAFGREGAMRYPEPVAGEDRGHELLFTAAGITQQFIHGTSGIRQNFILHERPNCSGAVRVRMSISSDLLAHTNGPSALVFEDLQGNERLRYADLCAWDATGAYIDSYMELSGTDGSYVLDLVADDRSAQYPLTIDPVSTTPTQLNQGTIVAGEMGISVATAGDLNGDGFSDVVVGAWKAEQGQVDEGLAYVYYGSAGGIGAIPDVTLQVDQISAQFGCAVNTAGDVNGDGYSDLLIGARVWENSSSEISEGAVFVYWGGPTGINTVYDQLLQSNTAGAVFGSNVAPVGDINGDGFSDVIVGAYLADLGFYQEGAAFIFEGSATGLNTTFRHRLRGASTGAFLGRSVAGAGDVNGDGFSDVIIGAPRLDVLGSNDGAALIWYGSINELGAGANPPPSVQLTGSGQNNASFGWSVTCAGDVNGDGYSDVAVGAYRDAFGQYDEGAAYVFHGSASGVTNTYQTQIQGNLDNAWLGRSISTAGDMNGDGYSELLIGATTYNNEGVGFLHFGSAAGIASAPSIILDLNELGANSGESVGVAGDVNGDGYSDILMGAPIYGSNGAFALFHGGPDELAASPTLSRYGNNNGDRLGLSVGNAGDVNGDGYADVIVSDPEHSNGQLNEGRVYVHHGSPTGVVAAPSTTLEVNIAGMQLGLNAKTAGDVNGDGYADVLATGANGTAGRTYIFHGGPGGISTVPATTINGPAGTYSTVASTAGDINSDGYSDIVMGGGAIVAAPVIVFLGSPAGIVPTPHAVLAGVTSGPGALGSAGDVNGDGFSDIIIGDGSSNTVRIFHGSVTGLALTPAITLAGPAGTSSFGSAVSGAGDVNGDGYFDVVIGDPAYTNGQTNEGGAFVYYGSAAGVVSTGATLLQRNLTNAIMGTSVGEAGDINGDGYADVVIGAPKYNIGGPINEGVVFIYRGTSSGTSQLTPDLVQSDIPAYPYFGYSVAGAGDVDGDGYSDVIVGAPFTEAGAIQGGAFHVYHGNNDISLNRITRQYQADLINPLAVNCMDFADPNNFGIGHFARNHIQRSDVKLNWEVVFEGQPFNGSPITSGMGNTGTTAAWTDIGVGGLLMKQLIFKVPGFIRYKWRVRVEYHPSKLIDGQRFSRWFYGYATGHADIGVLPIELVDLHARAEGSANLISWSTASEENSDLFVIERSTDAHEFIPIGTQQAAGQSFQTLDYNFLDQAPLNGTNFYRLRMFDQNGEQELSQVVSVTRGEGSVSLFPNPASNSIWLGFLSGTMAGHAEIVDATGRTVRMIALEGHGSQLQVSLDDLAPGRYGLLLRTSHGSVIEHHTFLKQ